MLFLYNSCVIVNFFSDDFLQTSHIYSPNKTTVIKMQFEFHQICILYTPTHTHTLMYTHKHTHMHTHLSDSSWNFMQMEV